MTRSSRQRLMIRLMVTLISVFAVIVSAACSKSTAEHERFHCPMHPTYISDKPGDCPICGMRLVPIKEGKQATPKEPAPSKQPPTMAMMDGSAQSGKVIWTCPMDPQVVSDKPGRCPVCGMALEQKANGEPDASTAHTADHKILYYRSPMDPKVTSPTPTKDSMGMDFVPVYADEIAQRNSVEGLVPIDVDAEGLRLAGVRTAIAKQEQIQRTIRAVGIVRADETRVRHVHTKVSGWVAKLFVNFTGDTVRKGQPILTLYSQELLATEQEYLRAREAAKSLSQSSFDVAKQGADDMLNAARRRLELFDVPKSLIARLDKTGVTEHNVTLTAPSSGIVTGKQVFEGQQVDPGMELFTVSDLSHVWIEADIYENEANTVHVGDVAKMSLSYDRNTTMTGKVKYIYPYLNAATRTLKVRFDFPNPDYKLKLDAYVNVELAVQTDTGVIVPDSAVMDTGLRQMVFVNTKEGHFEPRLVNVGIRANGKAQILSGVRANESVAVKANFLLDSESRLRAAISAPPANAGTGAAEAQP